MKKVHADLEFKEFEFSDEVSSYKYCNATGKLAGSKCDSTAKGYFTSETKPKYCNGVHPDPKPSDTTDQTPSDATSSEIVSSDGDTTSESSSPPEDSSSSNVSDVSSDGSSSESGESNDSSTDSESSENSSVDEGDNVTTVTANTG